MRILGLGHLLFAVGLAGLGVLSLFSGDFAYVWQPVPAGIPWREVLARCSGILLLGAGLGVLFRRTAATFALALTLYLLTWVLLLQSPRVARAPGDVGAWLGFCENLVLLVGGWLLFASLAGPPSRPIWKFVAGQTGVRVARLLFGGSCLVLGLSHLVYSDGTAGMVPAWLPDRLGFAYFTGAAHIAAGLGILSGLVPRLAATLEAIMISSFVILVHIPGVIAAPASRMQWTMVFVAAALAGSAWTTARSLCAEPWGLRRTARGNARPTIPAS
jgi:uncharacterized membrane protein YphA (DoxX/SURF4 family)